MAKWTLPEGKIYTQADLDAAVAAALKEVHDAIADYPRVAPDGVEAQHYDEQIGHSQSIILALIPDAGAALDRALAAQRERDAKVAEARADEKDSYGPDFDAGWEAAALVIAAAIRAQGDKP